MSRHKRNLTKDLAGELNLLLKADKQGAVAELQLPLLEMCADELVDSSPDPVGEAVSAAIASLETGDEKLALECLLMDPGRWEPLSARATRAAGCLGITYDAIRRRNPSGVRRLDQLMTRLASRMLEMTSVEELLGPGSKGRSVPDVSVDVLRGASVFLSYSRSDDQHEGGLVSNLRDGLVAEFRFQTGRDLAVFHDQSSIDIGENWRRKLETAIDSVAILIVMLTPSYLRSDVCRSELQRFFDREIELGRDDLVLPVYLATLPPDLHHDHLAEALLSRQYLDWRPLRFEPFDSVAVRSQLAALTVSVSSALARTTGNSVLEVVSSNGTSELGLVERMAEMDLALPRLVRSMMTMGEEQEGITAAMQNSSAEMARLDRMGRGASARLVVARNLARSLEPYADRMEECAEDIRDSLDGAELGVMALVELLPGSEEDGVDEIADGLSGSLHDALVSSREAAKSVEGVIDAYEEISHLVSTLRPVFARLTAAAQAVRECPDRLDAWVTAIDGAIEVRRSAS